MAFSDAPAVQAQMDGYDEQQHGEAEQEEGIDGDGFADVAMQQDMQQIVPQVAEGEQVGIPMSLAQEWSLYAYYYREKHIDLTRIDLQNLPEALPRHLLTDGRDAVPQELYTEKTLATRQYKLYELKQ